MYDIIFLRGAPGVGKSTLSRKLKPIFQNGVTIEVTSVRKMINNFITINSDQHVDSLFCTYKLALEYLDLNYKPIVIVDSMKAYKLQKYFLSKFDKNLEYLIITLYASNKVIGGRIDSRLNGFNNKTASYLVNKDIKSHQFENEIKINTSRKSPDSVFNEIKNKFHILI